MFVPARSEPESLQVKTTFDCNIYDSFIQDCRDTSETGSKCEVGIYHLMKNRNSTDNSSTISGNRSCAFTCQTSQASSEFEVCMTNSLTDPFIGGTCNGTKTRTRRLTFAVPHIDELIMEREISKDSFTIGSLECHDYDLKDVDYGKDLTQHARQILCNTEISLECTITCGDKEEKCEDNDQSFDVTFFTFFVIFLIANITFAPIFPILDAVAYDLLAENRHIWGKQRVWGTLGFALFAVSSSFIMHMLKDEEGGGVDYRICFYIFGLLSAGAAVIAYFIEMSSDIK